ncbi:unnamed protein product [Nippostrongylus brasiliensis]|uniref:Uncharacterized protein n=1 Tax=Nippostrongylus brasiliensis TaxID=27835 RepID=A0A0N4YE32_NIPBR|nr:unnamed protein product [Nippostrongylus brasiliensis]
MYQPRAMKPNPSKPSGATRPSTSGLTRHTPYPRARVLSREIFRRPPAEEFVPEDEIPIGEQEELPQGICRGQSTSTESRVPSYILRFFSSLGNTYDERSTALNVLIDEREDWRKQMNKSLQVALRDVRNYVYGEKDGVYQWIKNSWQKRGEEREDHGDLDPNAAML